jgi:hypothetical protein
VSSYADDLARLNRDGWGYTSERHTTGATITIRRRKITLTFTGADPAEAARAAVDHLDAPIAAAAQPTLDLGLE